MRRNAVAFQIEVELSPVFHTFCSETSLSVQLEEEEATVKGLLRNLSSTYGERMKALLFGPGRDEVVSGMMIMVNDRTFTGNALNQEDVPLQDKDRVSLLYFVSGG